MVAIMQNLAAFSSASPTDASALDASISALKNSISALESSLKTLEVASTPWEWVVIVSSFVVFVGIIGEVVVIISEDRENKHEWARGIFLTPDRAPRWRFWLDIIATIIVLLGILGEAWGSLELASINSKLRSTTSLLRAKSDQLLAVITQEAGSAALSAQHAQGSADVAGRDAGNAKRKSSAALITADGAQRSADAVKKQAKDLSTQLADEKQVLKDFAICNAPRLIGFRYANGKLSTAPLLPYKGTEATIEYMPDLESNRAASNIYNAIKGAEWKVSPPKPATRLRDGVLIVWYTPGPPIAPPPPPSLLNRPFTEEARAAAEGLKEFLHSEYWQATSRDRFSDEPDVPLGGVKILVGLYPAMALVTPPAEAAVPVPKLPEEERQPCRPLSDLVANP